jgi:LPXTG-site transpeptidase (sortase) family protein
MLLLTTCIAVVLLSGLAIGLYSGDDKKPQPVQIAQVAPLTLSPNNSDLQSAVKAPPGLAAASVKQPPVEAAPTSLHTITAAGPTSTPTLPASTSPTATPKPTPTSPPLAAAPLVTQPGSGTRLVIPKLSLDTPVLYAPVKNGTWQVDHLLQAVGYLEGTAPPGSDSNFVVAGHVTLEAGVYGPFANLGYLAPGDLVIIYQRGKEIPYLVSDSYVVGHKTVDIVYPSDTGQITLITCINWNGNQGRYTDRLVVKGRLIKSQVKEDPNGIVN